MTPTENCSERSRLLTGLVLKESARVGVRQPVTECGERLLLAEQSGPLCSAQCSGGGLRVSRRSKDACGSDGSSRLKPLVFVPVCSEALTEATRSIFDRMHAHARTRARTHTV